MNLFSMAFAFFVDLKNGAIILKVCPILDRQVKLKRMEQRQKISKSVISRANLQYCIIDPLSWVFYSFLSYICFFSLPPKINTSLFRKSFGQFYERVVTVEECQFLKRNYHLVVQNELVVVTYSRKSHSEPPGALGLEEVELYVYKILCIPL